MWELFLSGDNCSSKLNYVKTSESTKISEVFTSTLTGLTVNSVYLIYIYIYITLYSYIDYNTYLRYYYFNTYLKYYCNTIK